MKKLIYLFVAVFLTSCCGGGAPVGTYVDPLLMEYFRFWKVGSYWVYENQDKTKRDSVYVEKFTREFVNKECDKDEFINIYLKSTKKYVEILGFRVVNIKAYLRVPNFKTFEKALEVNNDSVLTDYKNNFPLTSIILNKKEFKGEIQVLTENDKLLYLQKGVGYIGFVLTDEKNSSKKDTFNLVNYHLEL